MNVERLNYQLRRCGKTKAQIASECGISKVTLDNALHGGDIRVSILESIARAVGIPVGTLFDDAPAAVIQTGGQNNVNGDNIRNADPADLMGMVAERDRQVNRLISLLERALALGKFSAADKDAPENT
ncbi:MAG: helix-turn-helix domain-containing protein [Bacteroidales bacterium]|nr:helix-turn-helix domain-containing protein [Bacteroidales bacterium]